jgi:hypothetical protein
MVINFKVRLLKQINKKIILFFIMTFLVGSSYGMDRCKKFTKCLLRKFSFILNCDKVNKKLTKNERAYIKAVSHVPVGVSPSLFKYYEINNSFSEKETFEGLDKESDACDEDTELLEILDRYFPKNK